MAREVILAEKQQLLLARRVFTAMTRQGLSTPELARRSHLPLSTVQKIVAGNGRQTSVWTVWALAAALGVSLDWLVKGDESCRTGP